MATMRIYQEDIPVYTLVPAMDGFTKGKLVEVDDDLLDAYNSLWTDFDIIDGDLDDLYRGITY